MILRWLADLRRRKVLRVAGGYTVAGWGVVQAAEAAAPILADIEAGNRALAAGIGAT